MKRYIAVIFLHFKLIICKCLKRIYSIDHQYRNSSTDNILSFLCISGVTFRNKFQIISISLLNCNCNHNDTRLTINLFDFYFSVLLSVTVFLVIIQFFSCYL